jgi:hypothetical protein
MKLAAFIAATLIPIAGFAQQTVTLRDGTQFHGRIAGATDDSISFRSRDGDMRRFDVNQIDTIQFDHDRDRDRDRGAAAQDNGQYNNQPGYNQAPVRDNRGYNAPPAGNPYNNSYMSVPAGTEIAIRANESINTRDTASGRTFAAQVDRDIVDANGQLLIPRGSDARLVVRRVGDNSLALDLQSISMNGQSYIVNTNNVVEGTSRDGVGANRRTAEYTGGGAVLGTLLGAIAGGGKGAAIGALAGGAVGAGTQTLTRGNEVHVPAETVLTFRLDNSLNLTPSQR